MGVSNLRHASHSLKLGRVTITEQFKLLGIEFNVILNVPVGIQSNIRVIAPFSKMFGNPRFRTELKMT